MRLFIAVDIPDHVKEKITYVQERIADYPGVSIVKKDNLHHTLKFIGEAPESRLPEIKGRLSKALKEFLPFDALVSGMGVFPHERHVRIVWVGTPALSHIQKAVMEEFHDGKKEAVPHITTARLKHGKAKAEIMKHIDQLKGHCFGTMRVSEVKIKSSTLTPGGPVYRDVETIKLG